jgi:uncharacterized protein
VNVAPRADEGLLAVSLWEAALLILGGFVAGVVNSMAGGGSLLTVPLLVLAGVPGNQANGSNRIGILTSNAAAVISFRRLGVDGIRAALPVLAPVVVGSVVGSLTIARLADDTFELVFGLLMIPLVLLTVFQPRPRLDTPPWPAWVTVVVFLGIGIYGGAFQAGVGLVLVAALTRAGFDLVMANSIKVSVNVVVTAIALPVFIIQGNVVWLPALVLALGFTAGGYSGAHVAVRGGERVVRVVMLVAALGLSGRLLGLY